MWNAFLLGVVATTSITAGIFFLRFWRETRDRFFLAFGSAFIIEGINRTVVLLLKHPNEGNPWHYLIRLLAFLLILIAIVQKNYGQSR